MYSCSVLHCIARSCAGERSRDARDAELDGPGIELVEIRPLGGNPPLVAERAEFRVRTVIVQKARENLRDHLLPARIRVLGERPLQRRLVGVDEALAHLLRRLPSAVGHAGRAVDVLDVLLDELAAVGAERGIEELDGRDTVEVGRAARLAHAVEHPHDMMLAGDDVLGRQVTQPRRHGPRGYERVGVVLGRGSQESKHVRRQAHSVARATGLPGATEAEMDARVILRRHTGLRLPHSCSLFIYSSVRTDGQKTEGVGYNCTSARVA